MPTKEEIEAAAAAEAEEARRRELATTINAAVATHLKGLRPKLVEELKGALTEAIGPQLAETIQAHLAEFQKNLPGGAGGGGGGEPPHKTGADPQILAMQQRMEQLEKQNKEERAAREAAETGAWQEKSYAALQNHLQGKVRPELLGFVADHLFKVQGRVIKHDDGSPLFKLKKAPLPGMAEEEQNLPLESGVEEWLRSKEAAPFVPAPDPKNTRRAGAQFQGRNASGGRVVETPQFQGEARTSSEKTRRAMTREAQLAEQFPHLAR